MAALHEVELMNGWRKIDNDELELTRILTVISVD